MRVILRLVLGLVLTVLVGWLALAVTPRIQASIAVHQLDSSDPALRKRGITYIRDERETSALPALLNRLQKETDPALVELLGYSLMRMQDLRGLAPLQARADREIDPVLKARLIYDASRLAGRDYRIVDWLRGHARSSEPWTRVAGCVGLLELGRLEGGDLLLQNQASLPAEPRDFAFQEFRRVLEPMGETVGAPPSWPVDGDAQWEASWACGRELWRRYATVNLLGDVLTRLDRTDPDWRDVERVLHGRWYASKWIH